MTYTEYAMDGVSIGIFGEMHTFDRQCISELPKQKSILFHNFLDMALRSNQDKLYDFYLEMNYIQKATGVSKFRRTSGTFGFIEGLLTYCLLFDKRSCNYPNLRAHYVDIRYTAINENFDRVDELYNSGLQIPADLAHRCINDIEKLLIGDKLIVKEISKSYYPDQLRLFALASFIAHRDNILQTLAMDSQVNPIRIILFYALVMDVYTLARMFRYFDGQPVKNIVVYVGDAHARNYNDFIINYLHQTPMIRIGNSSRFNSCLHVGSELQKSVLFNGVFGQKI